MAIGNKEACIAAGIVGGCGGAGAAYHFDWGAPGPSDFRTPSGPSFDFGDLGCSKELFADNKLSVATLSLGAEEINSPPITYTHQSADFSIDPKKGCLDVNTGGDSAPDKDLKTIKFEMAAVDDASSPQSGIVVLSILSGFAEDADSQNAKLRSRAFYLTRNQSWSIKKGLEFTSDISKSDGQIIWWGSSGIKLKDICVYSDNTCSVNQEIKSKQTSPRLKWKWEPKTEGTNNDLFWPTVKISSSSKHAIFFGSSEVSSPSTLSRVLQEGKWHLVQNPPTFTLFAASNTKNTWEPKIP